MTGLRFLSFLLAAQPGTQPDTRGSIQLQHEARSPGCTPARTGHTGFLSYVQHGGQMTSRLCCPLPERWLCPCSWAACGLLAQIPDSVMKGNLHHPLLFVLSTVTLSPPCHPGWHWGHKSQLLTREGQALNVLLQFTARCWFPAEHCPTLPASCQTQPSACLLGPSTQLQDTGVRDRPHSTTSS